MGLHKNKIKNFLNSDCLVNANFNAVTVDALWEFSFIFLFVLVFKPYVINELSTISVFEVSIATALIFSFFSWIYNLITYKKIDIKCWTFKKDMVRYAKTLLFTTIIFLSYVYIALHYIYNNEITSSVNYFFIAGFFHIFFIAIIVYFFSKSITYIALEKHSSKQNTIKVKSNTHTFIGKNKNEIFKIELNKLICIQSTGHYVNFFLKTEEDNVEIKTIRNNLGEIKKIIQHQKNMFQCHRSYIVNIDCIKNIIGNSQKACLTFKNSKDKVPISRENYKWLKKMYTFDVNKDTFSEKKDLESA